MGQFPTWGCVHGKRKSSVALSQEPAYGMMIRLNLTASVSVSSPGGGEEERLKVLTRFQGQFHFVFYYKNSSCETIHVFGVIWLDLFHCTWHVILVFGGRVSVFFHVVFAEVDAPFPAFRKKSLWFVMLGDLLLWRLKDFSLLTLLNVRYFLRPLS